MWQGEAAGMCRWKETTAVQVKSGDRLANCLGGVPIFIKYDRRKRRSQGDYL